MDENKYYQAVYDNSNEDVKEASLAPTNRLAPPPPPPPKEESNTEE